MVPHTYLDEMAPCGQKNLNSQYSCQTVYMGQPLAMLFPSMVITHSLEYTIGSAHIFKRTGTTWVKQDTLAPSDGDTNNWFGYSVSLHGEFALIGSLTNDCGAAYMFKQSGTHWMQTQTLLSGDAQEGDGFGYSVSLSKNYALLGAPGKDHGEGIAYVFKRIDNIWRQESKLTASDGTVDMMFGSSVSISGKTVVVGAPDFYWGTGSAYIFQHV